MSDFTKQERAAIDKAWRALEYLCGTTNMSDAPRFRQSFRMERAERGDTMGAKASMCQAWLEGWESKDVTLGDSRAYYIREGYLFSFLLGVRHACERADHESIAELLELIPAAIAADKEHTARLVDQTRSNLEG